MNHLPSIARSASSVVPALLLSAVTCVGCLTPPPISEIQAQKSGKVEAATTAPSSFYEATWADSSGKDGKGGTKLNASEGKKNLPLREDTFIRKLRGDASITKHPKWMLFHSQSAGGKALAFEWKWTTNKDDKFYGSMWAGCGVAFDQSWSNTDITGAKYLVMYAKASREDLPEMEFTVKLHSNSAAKGQEQSVKVPLQMYAEGKRIGTDWTRIVVPMKAFVDVDRVDITKLHTIDFDLAGKYPENEQLWMHFDNIYFSDAEMLTPVDNVGYVVAKDGVIILWDKSPGEKFDKFIVNVDGKTVATVDASKREARLPLHAFPARTQHKVTVVAANSREMSSPQGAMVMVSGVAPEPAVVTLDAKPGHEISPLMFGSNFMSPEGIKETGTTINRWGGNTTSMYNWKGDLDNKGNDWFFLDDFSKPDKTPESEKNYYKFIKDTLGAGAAVNFTLPIGPYIAKPHPSGGRYCSFPTKIYPDQDKTDGQGCGNGVKSSKELIWDNDPNISLVPNSPEFQRGLVENIKKEFGGAAGKGVRYYSMDNEPGLWNGTHRDAVPKGLTTDELIDLNVKFATMVKSVDPDAKVIGFAAWGIKELAGSNLDFTPAGSDGYKRYDHPKPEEKWSDRKKHGDQPQLVTFLKGMKKAEEKAGKRLIDIVDVHWYPECYGKDSKGEVKRLSEEHPYDEVLAKKQFDSLREWYDGSYKAEESWTASDENKKYLWDAFHPVIPAIKKIIDDTYPGTKLAINEYQTSSQNHHHGALIRAAVLGIFMQEDLFMAQNWYQGDSSQPAFWAQKLYGNYDGKGGKVRGRFVKTTSSHKDLLSYATDNAGKDDIILINKNPTTPLTVNVKLPHAAKTFQTFTLSEGVGQRLFETAAENAKGPDVSIQVPAYSVVLLVAQ